MRTDIINAFCEGKKPIDLIKENIASKKTVYYYHSIYSDMIELIKSNEFANEMVKLMLKLRIKS